MKVISIGTDRKLFEEGSQVFLRNLEYAKNMKELHIIVFAKKSLGLQNKVIGNLYLYPTNSSSRLQYIHDAFRIGKNLFKNYKLKTKDSDNFVISTQDPFETGYVGYKLKKIFNIPLQVQIHTDFLSPEFGRGWLNKIRLFLSEMVLSSADRVRVVSSVIRDSLIIKYPKMANNIDILPVFVDIKKIANTEISKDLKQEFPNFKFIILMASRLEKEKNIDTTLHSFKEVLKKYPHAGLVVAGEGSQRKKLETLSKSLQISNSVRFIGWQKDLISLYKTADLFLLTSKYEGYGMTLLEAGASGCPIVTTKVGLAKTDLFKDKENSRVCETFDVSCITDAILETIADNQTREFRKHKMQNDIQSIALSFPDYVNLYVENLNKTGK